MARLMEDRAHTAAVTMVGVFSSGAAARKAAHALDISGFPAGNVGIVDDNVRNAREVAGSFSPQGALGGVVLIVAFTAIGWLAGRARLFKQEEYAKLEDAVDTGATLVWVVCETAEGADQARAILERSGARTVRREESSEAV